MGNKGGKDGKKAGGGSGAAASQTPKHTEWPGIPPRLTGTGTADGSGETGTAGKTSTGLKLTDHDYTFLTSQTGMSREAIKQIFDDFLASNPDGKLDRREFVQLYTKLRPEASEQLDEIAQLVFRAFDADRNGSIDFNEFMIAYSLTSRGDVRKKLEYAFAIYDADNNGYLDRNELREVITGMLDLLGADKKTNDVNQLTEECIRGLDVSKDGQITKNEFIDGLLKNYSLRSLMSPFN